MLQTQHLIGIKTHVHTVILMRAGTGQKTEMSVQNFISPIRIVVRFDTNLHKVVMICSYPSNFGESDAMMQTCYMFNQTVLTVLVNLLAVPSTHTLTMAQQPHLSLSMMKRWGNTQKLATQPTSTSAVQVLQFPQLELEAPQATRVVSRWQVDMMLSRRRRSRSYSLAPLKPIKIYAGLQSLKNLTQPVMRQHLAPTS